MAWTFSSEEEKQKFLKEHEELYDKYTAEIQRVLEELANYQGIQQELVKQIEQAKKAKIKS
jgi:hypothetical protein